MLNIVSSPHSLLTNRTAVTLLDGKSICCQLSMLKCACISMSDLVFTGLLRCGVGYTVTQSLAAIDRSLLTIAGSCMATISMFMDVSLLLLIRSHWQMGNLFTF